MQRIILFRDKVYGNDFNFTISVDEKDFVNALCIIDDCIDEGDDDYESIEQELVKNGITFKHASFNIDEVREIRC